MFHKYPQFIGGCVWEWCDHTFIVKGVQKYGGDYALKVYCDNPSAVHFKVAGEPINVSYENGYAVTHLKLDSDVNAASVSQVEISFDAPCEVSRIVMYGTDYLTK